MKTRRTELDVDFIGGGDPLTKEEEKRISDFIKANKGKQRLAPGKGRRKITAQKKRRHSNVG